MSGAGEQRVVVVTGGGGGIGAAIAEALGRVGCFVVTVDPLVSVDGVEVLPPTEETTAGRIVAAGGAARASSISVTDAAAVQALFQALVEEQGRLDAVVNVAGITRPTGFAKGSEGDWRDVLSVHLDGWLNVLRAALPIMAAAGRGHLLGVTSGSGWRAADAGAYSSAKRAVASITWQIGRAAPDGVVVNAMSPIAATRMVTAALGRAPKASASTATGGLSLGSMPTAEQLGPIGAHLVGAGFAACQGRVVFVAGAEVAVVDAPRLLEVVRTDEVASVASLLDVVVPGAFAPAEAAQATNGGSNPRFPGAFEATTGTSSSVGPVALVSDRSDVVAALANAGVGAHVVDPEVAGFVGAAEALRAADEAAGPLAGVVVALSGPRPSATEGWQALLDEHADLVADLHLDAAWVRATADLAAATERSIRLVTVTDAATSGGRSRAQSAAQLARSGRAATAERVEAFAVGLEATGPAGVAVAAELVAHLLGRPEAGALAGGELVVADGWLGLRAHPRPAGSVTYGGPAVPAWLDATLEELAR